ncbi:MAG: polyprenyl synthetase family protein [Halobacteriota archaeon]
MSAEGVDRDALEAAIDTRRRLVNDAIPEEVPVREPTRLWEASRYLLDAGGKRLRPTVLLLMAEALADVEPGTASYRSFPTLGSSRVDVLAAAVSVEIIQTFTLIHDDIMDADAYRRGVETVHEAFDLETAILAGDTLYATSFERMLETGATAARTNRALGLLARTCTSICEGQARDVGFEGRDDVSLDAYLEMIEQKTAVLYATSAALPGVLLGADDATIDELYAFGLDFGRAFQIKDDLLDLTADTATLGKDRGSDLFEGKRTVVTIHAREQGVDVDALVDDPDVSLEAVVETLEEVGSLGYAETLAQDFVESAKGRLDVVDDSTASQLLGLLAEYVIEREY